MRVVVGAAKPTRMSSMEREPKTLSLDELNYAREAALYVLSTRSCQDAARIFTKGLKPVLGVTRNSTTDDSDWDSDDDEDEDDVFDPDVLVDDDHDVRRHRRLPRRIAKERDFATAPF